MKKPSDFEYTNRNIEVKIAILHKMIKFYEERIQNALDSIQETTFKNSLNREQGYLKAYKSKYPEFFI